MSLTCLVIIFSFKLFSLFFFFSLQMNVELLKKKSDMLNEYFGLAIDPDGNISRLPVVLDQYTPDMDRMPEFMLCLGNDVGSEIY